MDESALQTLLAKVFDGLRERVRESVPEHEYEEMKRDFIFHMTDWRDDAEQLVKLLSLPDEWDTESATTFIAGFLYHVVPHLKNARELLLDRDIDK